MKFNGYNPEKKGLQKFMSEEEELILKFLWSCNDKSACLNEVVNGINNSNSRNFGDRKISRYLAKLERKGFIKSEVLHSSKAEKYYSTVFNERELLRELVYLTIKHICFFNPIGMKKAVNNIKL
ncbi:hypothetical protein JW865_07170 [Candidatus Bathyarchaeota archaeon]|nr:hypothetical protein [Candidatus Bathyarchaeota archaeon]